MKDRLQCIVIRLFFIILWCVVSQILLGQRGGDYYEPEPTPEELERDLRYGLIGFFVFLIAMFISNKMQNQKNDYLAIIIGLIGMLGFGTSLFFSITLLAWIQHNLLLSVSIFLGVFLLIGILRVFFSKNDDK